MTLIRIFEELRALGYEGGYDAVRRYTRAWSKARGYAVTRERIVAGEFVYRISGRPCRQRRSGGPDGGSRRPP